MMGGSKDLNTTLVEAVVNLHVNNVIVSFMYLLRRKVLHSSRNLIGERY